MRRLTLSLIVLLASIALAFSGSVDGQIDGIIEQYTKIHTSLTEDSTDGVDAAAQSIQQLASQLPSTDPATEKLGAELKKAAQQIQGKDLDQSRVEFFELSKPLLVYLAQSYSGEKAYYRFYCDMAKKGWVQSEKGVRNPYYGSSMLTCGELIK